MMILKSIEINNVEKIKNLKVNFKPGLTLVVSDYAKSNSFIRALNWILGIGSEGCIEPNVNTEAIQDLVNIGYPMCNMFVELQFLINNKEMTIRKMVSFYVKGKYIDCTPTIIYLNGNEIDINELNKFIIENEIEYNQILSKDLMYFTKKPDKINTKDIIDDVYWSHELLDFMSNDNHILVLNHCFDYLSNERIKKCIKDIHLIDKQVIYVCSYKDKFHYENNWRHYENII